MRDQEPGTTTERRAREVFDESVGALDARTLSRLNRARQAAVASVESKRHSAWRSWAPVAAAASVALVAVLLWRAPAGGPEPATQAGAEAEAMDVVELLSAGDDLELAADDPAFYAWLDSDDLATANGSG
jgi:hypothetical protein